MTGTTDGLDRLLSDPTRLAIMATLCATEWCDFSFLRDTVQLSDSALSKQISTLRTASQVEISKTYRGRVPKTRLRATTTGQAVFFAHVAALRAIVDQATNETNPQPHESSTLD